MGRLILAMAYAQRGHFEVRAAVDVPGNPLLGSPIGSFSEYKNTDVRLTDSLKSVLPDCDVVIDFSASEQSVKTAQECAQAGVAVVIGTTGLNAGQVALLDEAAKSVPVVYAPNMSVGVNLLFKLAGMIAQMLDEDYDVEIVEAHHRFKKDAPSGTACRLAEIIAQARGVSLETHGNYGRKGMVGERKAGEIGIHTVRMGNVVGDHTVTFANLGERIELTHKAQSRETFALGALKAARFIADKKSGRYDMQDVLGLR
jgi:4-hydroxy-tetrahydrodipicolinate reductase